MKQQWSAISDDGPARPVVLAVDFDASGRKEATFHDLVELFPRPLTVWLGTQPPESYEKGLSPSEYLAWWAGESLDSPTPVGAVLGYCAGSLFASALADELEERQGFRPRTVLFNPGKPDASTLRRDFEGTMQSMSLLSPEERSAFVEQGGVRLGAASASFDEACGAVLDLYGRASRVTFARAGIDADVGEELLGVFRSYTSYLRAAREMEYRAQWAGATAVLSQEHPREPAFTHTEIRTEVGRERLLADPEVARTVFRLIESEA